MAYAKADVKDLRETIEDQILVSLEADAGLKTSGTLGVKLIRKRHSEEDVQLATKQQMPAITVEADSAAAELGLTLNTYSRQFIVACQVIQQGTDTPTMKGTVKNIVDSLAVWLSDNFKWQGDELGGLLGGNSPVTAGAEGWIEEIQEDAIGVDTLGTDKGSIVSIIGGVMFEIHLVCAFS